MPNYNVWDRRGKGGSGGNGFRKGGFGNRPERCDFRRDYSFDKPKFPAVCAECGERCAVPFKPIQGKPVYCSNCFRRDERSIGDRHSQKDHCVRNKRFQPSERHSEGPSRQQDSRTDYKQLNCKLDVIIELLKDVRLVLAKQTQDPVAAKNPALKTKHKVVAITSKEEKDFQKEDRKSTGRSQSRQEEEKVNGR